MVTTTLVYNKTLKAAKPKKPAKERSSNGRQVQSTGVKQPITQGPRQDPKIRQHSTKLTFHWIQSKPCQFCKNNGEAILNYKSQAKNYCPKLTKLIDSNAQFLTASKNLKNPHRQGLWGQKGTRDPIQVVAEVRKLGAKSHNTSKPGGKDIK